MKDELKIVIDELIALIETGTHSIKHNESRLNGLLDELAVGIRVKSTTFGNIEYPDPPERNQKELRDLVCSRFPDYGYYNIPESILWKIGESEVIVGDAIDDIVDITNDLSKIAWRWEHNDPDDAIWHFYRDFVSHWGLHLRSLQLYVHLSRYGE